MDNLTHFNEAGEAHMVDVGDKTPSKRTATAFGSITMKPETFNMILAGNHKKGDVLGIARIAGIMGAKRTSDLIPLCHPLPLTKVAIEFTTNQESYQVDCEATVATTHVTGVEMEALTAVQIALLTIFDMCKAVDKSMVMGNIHVRSKTGGKSGDWNA